MQLIVFIGPQSVIWCYKACSVVPSQGQGIEGKPLKSLCPVPVRVRPSVTLSGMEREESEMHKTSDGGGGEERISAVFAK